MPLDVRNDVLPPERAGRIRGDGLSREGVGEMMDDLGEVRDHGLRRSP